MKLPSLTAARRASTDRNAGSPAARTGVAPSSESWTVLGNCQVRCFQGWCRECCPGAGCVNYPDPNSR